MAQPTVRTLKINASSTWWSSRSVLASGNQYSKQSDKFYIPVEVINQSSGDGEVISYAVFEWDFATIIRTTLGITGDALTELSITGVELDFYYQKADSPNPIGVVEFITIEDPPSSLTAQELWTNVNTAISLSITSTLYGNNKTRKTVTLASSSSDSIVPILSNGLKTDTVFILGIRRQSSSSFPADGYTEIGGKTMLLGEDTQWRSSVSPEIALPPSLSITYEIPAANHTAFSLRYTTSDPTTSQSTPSNSIGGYMASNEVFFTSQLADYLASDDTSVLLTNQTSLSDVPDNGLIQVGSEIIRYAEINRSNFTLRSLTRPVVPTDAYPSSLDPFPEYVHFLDTSKLFDNRPAIGFEQYRCVAVVNTSSYAASQVRVTLVQDITADVQIDWGIEVPKFESKIGTTNADISSGSNTLTSSTATVRNKAADYFNTGHIIIDPSGSATNAIISDYVDNGSQAVFTLDRTLSAFSSGTSFRINPAPSQRVAAEFNAPAHNSSRFFGFINEGGANSLSFGSEHEHQGTLNQYDVMYIWLKRSLSRNVKTKPSTSAFLIIRFVDASGTT